MFALEIAVCAASIISCGFACYAWHRITLIQRSIVEVIVGHLVGIDQAETKRNETRLAEIKQAEIVLLEQLRQGRTLVPVQEVEKQKTWTKEERKELIAARAKDPEIQTRVDELILNNHAPQWLVNWGYSSK